MFKRLNQEWSDYRAHCFLEPSKLSVFEFARYFVSQMWAEFICRHKGCDWGDDEGYATPDSGAMEFTCKRCGDMRSFVLY